MNFLLAWLSDVVAALDRRADRLWEKMPPMPADELTRVQDHMVAEIEKRTWESLGDGGDG